MSKFSWIMYSYVAYVITLLTGNIVASAMSQPILALGWVTKWYVVVGVFILVYISEWLVVVYEKQ